MGLDMYLTKKTYVKNWDFDEDKHRYDVSVQYNGADSGIVPARVQYVEELVAYWRKANQIHAWFVDNVQDGVDECQQAWVTPEKLTELLNVCKRIRNNPKSALDLLPPRAGFFFGSTEVDEWYMQDIEYTITTLEEELARPTIGRFGSDYYYRSSW